MFIVRDLPEKSTDEKLSDHILGVHRTGGTAAKPPIPPELLRKYISYGRARIFPKLTKEAVDHLKQFYLRMREASSEGEGTPIAITARQLEALIRLSEARARSALRQEVTKIDAEAAIRIMQKFLKDVGALKEAEVIDIDVIMTGKSTSLREGLINVLKLVGEMEKESDEAELENLYGRLEKEFKVSRRMAEDFVRRLLKEGTLYSPREGYVKRTIR